MVLYEASQVRDAIGCGCAALLTFAGLGLVVSHQPPMLFDLAGASLAGTGLPAALFFTHAGEFPMYASICGFLLVVGFLYRKWLLKISIPIISLVIMWQVSDLMKLAFNRQRPGYWSLIHESSASYPSGHVVLATTFYGFWAYLAWCSNLPAPARVAIVAALLLWIMLISWSRLALGAHFPTDLIGGYLLGVGAVFFEISVLLVITSRKRA